MRKFSNINRNLDREKHLNQENSGNSNMNKWAERFLSENNVDYILCGHNHTPQMQDYAGGTYLNAGSFYNHRSLILYNKENFALVKWNKKMNKFNPFQPLSMPYE